MDIDANLGPLYMKNFDVDFTQADLTHLRESMYLHTLNLDGASIGPPCQPFTLGMKKGLDDPRALSLFMCPVVAKIAGFKFVLFEEVASLTRMDNGSIYKTWLQLWEIAGFVPRAPVESLTCTRPNHRDRIIGIILCKPWYDTLFVHNMLHVLSSPGV
eukprot:4156635-Karenia_brevis.AAC.1